jgi:hypothetical protein
MLMDDDQAAKVLLNILAQINRRMMTMRTNLDERPEVRTANRTETVRVANCLQVVGKSNPRQTEHESKSGPQLPAIADIDFSRDDF